MRRQEIVTALGSFILRGRFRVGELVYVLGSGFAEVRRVGPAKGAQ